MHGETAIDDTSLVSFSSSLACPRGNRISGVNSSVDYPDEVRHLNLLAPRKERKKQMFKQLGHGRPFKASRLGIYIMLMRFRVELLLISCGTGAMGAC